MAEGRPGPTIVVAGVASRDLAPDDPRGWRLGGGVTYSALLTARLGVRTAALVGVDATAVDATELDLLRDAGVDLATVVLERAPVFDNVEGPAGRRQISHVASDPLPPDRLPPAWADAPGWILAPVAGELPDGWVDLLPRAATVALGWQGLLRHLPSGGSVTRISPRRSPLVERADLLGISRDDVDPAISLRELTDLLHPGATLVVTESARGGLVMEAAPDGPIHLRRYPAIPSLAPQDPTGAGDVFLAALAAARIEPRLVGGRIAQGYDLLLAAAAASLVLEAPGLFGVPDRGAVRSRMTAGRVAR